MWPGTQSISAGQYPDPGIPAAYFRAQQPSIISGLSASLNAAPGGNNTVTLAVYYTPAAAPINTGANYTGYITVNTLTVSTGPSFGAIAVGQTVSGSGIALNTYIVSGSGSTWTVFPTQTVGSVVSPIAIVNGVQAGSFTGSITGTALTITSAITGSVAIGQYVAGPGVTAGTYIAASTSISNVWTVSISQSVSSATLYTTGILPTPFTVTFASNETEKTYYNASTRLNTGDRIHLYISYTTNVSGSNTPAANQAHDITAQIDLF